MQDMCPTQFLRFLSRLNLLVEVAFWVAMPKLER